MRRYKFGDIVVSMSDASDVLPTADNGQALLDIRRGDTWDGASPGGACIYEDEEDETSSFTIHSTHDSYKLVVWNELFADIKRNGSGMVVKTAPSCSAITMEHYLLDNAIPRALTLHGRHLVHGSAVASKGRTIIFLGETGAGKSTLALNFALRGFEHLGDDSLVVRERNGVWSALATYQGIRLWPRDAARLLPPVAKDRRVSDYADKRRFIPEDVPHIRFSDGFTRIGRIYVVRPEASASRIHPCNAGDALIELLRHSFRLALDDKAIMAREFKAMAALAETGVVRFLDLSHEEPFEDVYKLIRQDFDD